MPNIIGSDDVLRLKIIFLSIYMIAIVLIIVVGMESDLVLPDQLILQLGNVLKDALSL